MLHMLVRFPARRLPLCEVVGAEKKEDRYISPSGIPFRRVSVWGVVVRKFVGENYLMLIIDDFTATIPVFLFGEVKDLEINEGDTVRVIGMVRERENEKRIIAEILRKIDHNEEVLHRLQNTLTMLRGVRSQDEEIVEEEEVEVVDVL